MSSDKNSALPFREKEPVPQTGIQEWATRENENELLALFKDAFGHDVTPEFWQWKYQDLAVQGAMVRHKDKLVAFYGGMPRPIRLFGAPATAVQIGDVMVHPQQRGILKRKGPFFLSAASFSERFVGTGNLFPLAFGFPSIRHYRLGVRLGLYEKVGEIMRVSWPALKALPSLKVCIRALKTEQQVVVERLWSEMAEALRDQIVGIRDWNYIQRRYLRHPSVSYQIFLVSSRWTKKPVGIIVIRILEDSVELVDLIAPLQRIPVLVNCLRRLAWNLKKPLAYTWITAQHASLLAGEAGEITSLDIPLPNICWTQGIPAHELLDRWWLMSGDSDFR